MYHEGYTFLALPLGILGYIASISITDAYIWQLKGAKSGFKTFMKRLFYKKLGH